MHYSFHLSVYKVTQDDEIQDSYIQPQDKQQWLWNMISGHDHMTVDCRISYIPILRNKKNGLA